MLGFNFRVFFGVNELESRMHHFRKFFPISIIVTLLKFKFVGFFRTIGMEEKMEENKNIHRVTQNQNRNTFVASFMLEPDFYQ